MKTPKFRIADCPECKRETLMVRTELSLRPEWRGYDPRWLNSWFCTSCSEYFEFNSKEEVWLSLSPYPGNYTKKQPDVKQKEAL